VRILVAEDEPLNALGLKSQLEGLGHDVIGPAANGREAVELAQRESVDLAILDIRMPELTGIEAAEQIFSLKPIPILLLTGFSNPDYIERASALPVYHYLVKPISAEDLGPAISVARARFQEWLTFRSEVDTLQRKLEERRIVERAKMLLMETRGLSETDAYRLLQKESQNRNQPMVEIARTILLAQTVLREASGTG
jgi:two-component system, response regulator PdtaR